MIVWGCGFQAPLQEAFRSADDVLRMGGKYQRHARPGLVNVDFVDVRSVMTEAGTALLGIGIGSGRSRATKLLRQRSAVLSWKQNALTAPRAV